MTTTARSPRPDSRVPILAGLHDDWHRIRLRADQLDHVRRWGLPGLPIGDLDELLGRCGYADGGSAPNRRGDVPTTTDRSGHAPLPDPDPDPDAVLIRLVELAADDPLAARIVLQRIVPPLCAVARRYSHSRQQRHELLGDLVANSWTVICRYPAARRRSHVAAGLVRDVTFETLVRPTRLRCAGEVPTETDLLAEPIVDSHPEPLHELVELLDDARRSPAVSDTDVAFICQLVTHGRPEELAVTLQVTPRTVRNRRDAIVRRLRAVTTAAA